MEDRDEVVNGEEGHNPEGVAEAEVDQDQIARHYGRGAPKQLRTVI